jgi:glycosyltransferase involved in cell wall biosynthesis
MKIAMIAAPIERIPPTKYGGTERVVSALTEELVRKGHKVTLFASGDSKTSAELSSAFSKPLREAYPSASEIMKRVQTTMLHLGKAYARQDEFDIIHDHTSYFGMTYAQSSRTPVVATLHGELNPSNVAMYEKLDKSYFVTISHAQRKLAQLLKYAATVYNGLQLQHYPFGSKSKGYLLAVGRFAPEKGIHNAIIVAKKLGKELIIAAKLEDQHKEYFEKMIKPFLNDKIRWVGEVGEKQRNMLMSGALCFLHPLEWEEPFGLTLIEAMACGTPVVAFNRGSMPEIIKNCKNGYITEGIESMVNAIKQIGKISRKECRTYALENFNAKKMAQDYEMVYESILENQYRYGQATHRRFAFASPPMN